VERTVDLDTHITLVTGNFGSGKSEVAVNWTRSLASRGIRVTLADLDVVKPYFRCREAAADLEAIGVRVIIPPPGWIFADLPIIVPEIRGAMQSEDGFFLGDVGGDDMGARVLGSFSDVLSVRAHRLLFVLNANRPFTETVGGAIRMLREIEGASRLRVTGLVANSHLMEETDLETILRGVELARAVEQETGAPLRFATAPVALAAEARAALGGLPVLEIVRTLLPPWRRRPKLGRENFRLGPGDLANL
jgi:hypothetical protein